MSLKDYSFTFNPNKKGLRKILGELEADIMEIVWQRRELTVRQVFEILQDVRNIAYTTVMTVMSRLADKGLLEKLKEGNAFIYRATTSRDEFTRTTLKKVINELMQDFTTPAINQFLDSMENVDPDRMEELSRLIEEKRKNKDV
ncbi:MAG: BlaI/MecI/CopY family transcriptional regulator [bacterium]